MEDRWLSVAEIAAYLGIKRDTVYRQITEKQMPAHRLGRLWKFKRDEVDQCPPGALPNSMTVEKMVAGQRSARNLIIVEVLRDYGYVDARGMGVRTKVIPALKAGGLEPIFQATDDYVKTTIEKIKGQNDLVNLPLTGEALKKRKKIRYPVRQKAGMT